MTHHPTAAGGESLLHCSADRTIVRCTDPETGHPTLLKILERGSLADARREVELGQRFEGKGVARYLDATAEPVTGRPCVHMEQHPGRDLEALVGATGPMLPEAAAAVVARVARALCAMHDWKSADAPHGFAHGDVKPANVLVGDDGDVRLLDLEQVAAQPAPGTGERGRGFSGGTTDFAPPEAFAGAAVDAGFDVYALGVTLHFAVTGQLPATRDRDAIRPELARLLQSCLQSGPTDRPTAAQVAEVLELSAQRPADALDAAFAHLQAGDLDAADAALSAGAGLDPQRHATLSRIAGRRRRLLERLPGLEQYLAEPGSEPEALMAHILRLQSFLRRFPRHRGALHLRATAKASAARLLSEVPGRVARLKRDTEHEAARALLDIAADIARSVQDLPGPFLVPGDGTPRMPGPMQRSTLQFLDRARQDLEVDEKCYQDLLLRLRQTEAQLQLDAAEAIVDEMAELHGGASQAVAELKDRLHQLGFYLDRLARSRPRVAEFAQHLELAGNTVELAPLTSFLELCGERSRWIGNGDPEQSSASIRGVQLTLDDLLREFAHLDPVAGPAARVLNAALQTMTEWAWRLLEEATQRLAAVPVPVRPLQSILHQLDTLRIQEMLIDLPDRSRTQLLDCIEAVRMRVDQARATRDRIARGAEKAMARGHWTTGLFDMERAVDHLEHEGEGGGESQEGQRLKERFEAAKRRKHELEVAMRRTIELASHYAAQQDDPDSSAEQRIQTLLARHECLEFLVAHLQDERGRRYANDLREVEVLIALEHSAEAERRFDASEDPAERLRIARHTLEQLTTPRPPEGSPPGPVGRVQRTLDHWKHQVARAEDDVQRRDRQDRAAKRTLQRLRLLMITAIVLGAGVVALATWALLR